MSPWTQKASAAPGIPARRVAASAASRVLKASCDMPWIASVVPREHQKITSWSGCASMNAPHRSIVRCVSAPSTDHSSAPAARDVPPTAPQ